MTPKENELSKAYINGDIVIMLNVGGKNHISWKPLANFGTRLADADRYMKHAAKLGDPYELRHMTTVYATERIYMLDENGELALQPSLKRKKKPTT